MPSWGPYPKALSKMSEGSCTASSQAQHPMPGQQESSRPAAKEPQLLPRPRKADMVEPDLWEKLKTELLSQRLDCPG